MEQSTLNLQNKNRLCVFSFFDTKGIMDDNDFFLIGELSELASELVIVINGKLDDEHQKCLGKYTDKIVIRENQGYDFGAYADVLLNYIRADLQEYDELILCNNTFYGPFVPLKSIFWEMEKKDIDFWGINQIHQGFMSHVQSYFITFRKNILQSMVLYNILSEMNKIADVERLELLDVYAFFEIGLCHELISRGYKYDSYVDISDYDIYRNPDICITRCKLPILKKKCLSEMYFNKPKLDLIIKYIEKETGYDVNLIKSAIYKKYGTASLEECQAKDMEFNVKSYFPDVLSDDVIEKFISDGREIYIYGTGNYARKLWFVFRNRFDKLKGFVVSDGKLIDRKSIYGYPVYYYREIENDARIIIGCDIENTLQIMEQVLGEHKVFAIWSDLFCFT